MYFGWALVMLKNICDVYMYIDYVEKLGGPIYLAMLWEMQLGRRGDVQSSQELIQITFAIEIDRLANNS